MTAVRAFAQHTGLAASLRRIVALVRRHAYLLLKSWPRLVSMTYSPTIRINPPLVISEETALDGLGPVIEAQAEAGLIAPVARLRPWVTFKA